MHRVQISPIHRFTDSPIRANFILRIKYIILYTTSARRAQCLSCAFLFLPQKEGLKIVHPCTIFNSSFCKAVRFAKTSITYSVSDLVSEWIKGLFWGESTGRMPVWRKVRRVFCASKNTRCSRMYRDVHS